MRHSSFVICGWIELTARQRNHLVILMEPQSVTGKVMDVKWSLANIKSNRKTQPISRGGEDQRQCTISGGSRRGENGLFY